MSLSLLLVFASWTAAVVRATPQVEWPDSAPRLEEPQGTIAERRRRCEQRKEEFYKAPSSDKLDALIFCTSHPTGFVRSSVIRSMVHRTRSLPDFPTAIYPKLKKLVEQASKDDDFEVRYAAGDLSRDLEHWENFDSPQAMERKRAHQDRALPGDWSQLGEIAVTGIILLVIALDTGLRRKKRRR